MKNTMKVVLCVALVLGVLFCLNACDGGGDTVIPDEPAVKQNITGRYELTKIEWEDGTVASGDTLQSSEDVMGDMYVELFSDGTANLSLYGQILDMEFSGGKMWQANLMNNSYEFSVSNGTVILKHSGDTYIFSKK